MDKIEKVINKSGLNRVKKIGNKRIKFPNVYTDKRIMEPLYNHNLCIKSTSLSESDLNKFSSDYKDCVEVELQFFDPNKDCDINDFIKFASSCVIERLSEKEVGTMKIYSESMSAKEYRVLSEAGYLVLWKAPNVKILH